MPESIDPASILVGQRAKFACSIPACTFHFWKTWQPADSSGQAFGASHCYRHNRNVLPVMVIVAVEQVQCSHSQREEGSAGGSFCVDCGELVPSVE